MTPDKPGDRKPQGTGSGESDKEARRTGLSQQGDVKEFPGSQFRMLTVSQRAGTEKGSERRPSDTVSQVDHQPE